VSNFNYFYHRENEHRAAEASRKEKEEKEKREKELRSRDEEEEGGMKTGHNGMNGPENAGIDHGKNYPNKTTYSKVPTSVKSESESISGNITLETGI
jgi:hypothetical protein